MPLGLGPWELIIVLLIVVVLFGAGRLSEIGGALGRGIKEFRSATRDEPAAPATPATPPAAVSASTTAATAPAPENRCPSCGTVNPSSQAYCGQCGTRLTRAA